MFFGEDKAGHPRGSLIGLIHRNVHTIKRYANAIADDLNSISRAEIHHDLCDKLCLNYKKFRPFEATDIKTLPTREGAEKILWEALGEQLREGCNDYSSL